MSGNHCVMSVISVHPPHLEIFEYSSSNFQAAVNVFRFSLRDTVEQANMSVSMLFKHNVTNPLTVFISNNSDKKTKKNKHNTYFSFPASLEANLVYQTATLKAMETSSKTASCWALRREQEDTVG